MLALSGATLTRSHACVAERDGEMQVLDLGNNSVSREGASALAAYMKKSSGLKELNLYMNDIGTAGITEVRPRLLVMACLSHAYHMKHGKGAEVCDTVGPAWQSRMPPLELHLVSGPLQARTHQ